MCRECRRSKAVAFGLIGLPDETLFPNIAKLRRFKCEGCG